MALFLQDPKHLPSYCSREVYVGDLDPRLTLLGIFLIFRVYGKIKSIEPGQDRCFPFYNNAIITFAKAADAYKAVYNVNYSYWGTWQLRCTFRVKNKELSCNSEDLSCNSEDFEFHNDKAKILVDGIELVNGLTLHNGYFIEYPNLLKLYEKFSRFGLIYRIRINYDKDGFYKLGKDGYFEAVIQYYDENSATKVIQYFKKSATVVNEKVDSLAVFNGKKLRVKRPPPKKGSSFSSVSDSNSTSDSNSGSGCSSDDNPK